MPQFKIQVSDTKGKYAAQVFQVEAEQEFLAYATATELYIKAVGHPARKPTQRMSSYYARFWNKVVA